MVCLLSFFLSLDIVLTFGPRWRLRNAVDLSTTLAETVTLNGKNDRESMGQQLHENHECIFSARVIFEFQGDRHMHVFGFTIVTFLSTLKLIKLHSDLHTYRQSTLLHKIDKILGHEIVQPKLS